MIQKLTKTCGSKSSCGFLSPSKGL
ncbi:MAG: hypothetical protein ACJAXZ_000836 [Akkermansiaceae bacterium]